MLGVTVLLAGSLNPGALDMEEGRLEVVRGANGAFVTGDVWLELESDNFFT